MWQLRGASALALVVVGCNTGGGPATPGPAKAAKAAPAAGEVKAGDAEAALRERLVEALKAKGAGYVPRTHHLDEGGAPTYINRLVFETSPYLLQHAHNPVDWFPWGEEAFARAKKLDRPILLSVGYSTCHWCHVMERESFEDTEIAGYINEHFVAIKVDREERPDVDDVYMAAVYTLAGRGGWPMTVVMTPDKQPFFAGTYFPPRDGARGARKGLFTILKELTASYRGDRAEIVNRAKEVTRKIQARARPRRPGDVPGPEALHAAALAFAEQFDSRWGGFGRAPKFPRPVGLEFLLRYHRRSGDPQALQIVRHTLVKMAAGGMYDHVGGGFHRYSTDTRWLVPHFEKMLYDNAQLTSVYLEAFQVTGDPELARVATETLDYVAREMTAPLGGFYSATDADSPTPDGKHREEGLFFIWTPAELEAVLTGEQARYAKAAWRYSERGNFEGANILNLPRPLPDVADELGVPLETLVATLDAARARLYDVRSKRAPPLRDDKVLTAWNALMISAFARGAQVLGRADYAERATKAANFLLTELRGPDGRLLRTYNEGRGRLKAYVQDYAFLVAALLDLYEATGELRWFTEAVALQATQDAHHADAAGGYFTTANDAEALLARKKPDYDGAVPSGNSVSALNLLRLAEFTTAAKYRDRATTLLRAFASRLRGGNTGSPKMLSALDYALDAPREVVIVEATPGAATELRRRLWGTYLPNKIVSVLSAADVGAQARQIPLLEAKVARDGQPTAYVCEKGRCELPTSDPAVFAAQLSKVEPIFPDRSADPLPDVGARPDPAPWTYDAGRDKHWHPGHGHWHDGKAPAVRDRK